MYDNLFHYQEVYQDYLDYCQVIADLAEALNFDRLGTTHFICRGSGGRSMNSEVQKKSSALEQLAKVESTKASL